MSGQQHLGLSRVIPQSRHLSLHERFREQQDFDQLRHIGIRRQLGCVEQTLVKTPFDFHDATQQPEVVVDGPRGRVKQSTDGLNLTIEGQQTRARVSGDRSEGGRQMISSSTKLFNAVSGDATESLEFVDEVQRLSNGAEFGTELDADSVVQSRGSVAEEEKALV